MSGKRSGQILYLAGSTSSHNSPGGSLSTRFQKLAQARSSGITVVNSTSSIETRSSTGLGLGRNTGSRPSGPGQRIVALHSNSSNHNHNTAAAAAAFSTGPNKRGGRRADAAGLGPGLHTAGGLARAMQERGTGVTDEFLLAPKLHLTPAGEGSGRGGGAVRRRGRGGATGPGAGPSNQASRHKSMVLGHHPTRQQKQNGGVSQQHPPPPSAPQQQQPGRGPAQAAKPKQGGGPKGPKGPKGAKNANGATGAKPAAPAGTKPQGKNKKGGAAAAAAAAAAKDKSKPNADKLDSELSDYMMKSEHTAASLLDNDLDMYMADRPEDNVW
ncbi:MAG: hypothetical protein J3Q66DRAFT_333937 [Benniella sp.]|nr:MAG: hypothetical protein J3Q66DRAFT_333937 [Benniella sp.]